MRLIAVLFFLLVFCFQQICFCQDMVTRLHDLVNKLRQTKESQLIQPYSSKGRRDPFVPLSAGTLQALAGKDLTDEDRDALPDLPSIREIKNLYPFILLGIIYTESESSLAIINVSTKEIKQDKIVKKGEEIAGARVTEIGKDYIKLLWKNKEIFLSIKY